MEELEREPTSDFVEKDALRPDLVIGQDPEQKRTIEDVLSYVGSTHLGNETINSLFSRWRVSEKQGENVTGYEEVAYFNKANGEVVINPELFGDKYSPEARRYAFLHETGHALVMEPHLVYENVELKNLSRQIINPAKAQALPEDLKITLDMIENPNEHIGRQGQWIDHLLGEITNQESLQKNCQKQGYANLEQCRLHKKLALSQEILADRLAAYLASDGTEETMLLKFIERIPPDAAKKLLNGAAPELKEACLKGDKEKIKELAQGHDHIKNIILESRVFHQRFSRALKQRSPEALKEIVQKNRAVALDIDDLDELFDGLYSEGIYEPPAMPNRGNSGGGFLDWLWKIFAPVRESI